MGSSNIFLTNIFNINSDSPSSVKITVPNPSGKSKLGKLELTGLMVGDPSFSAQNKWGTVINDISNLTDISSLLGSESLFSWVNASTMCWKGTSPLSMGIEFYLINYEKGLNLESKLKTLVKLASLELSSTNGVGSGYRVFTHGGYIADVLESNDKIRSYFTSGPIGSASQLGSVNMGGMYDADNNARGAISVQFGHKSKISNLLLSKIDVTESVIEVAEQNGTNPKPLYYRVSAQFTGVRPLVTSDVDRMFEF